MRKKGTPVGWRSLYQWRWPTFCFMLVNTGGCGDLVTCGTDTEEIGGVCVATSVVACGLGTELIGDECLPEKIPGEEEAPEDLLIFDLSEETRAYDELVPAITSMDALDPAGHLDQEVISSWAEMGLTDEQADFLFDHGDELSELEFLLGDGIGSQIMPDGSGLPSGFTRTPTGTRFTGPNAASCAACHSRPFGNGGGANVANVMQDPAPSVDGLFNVRQTTSIMGGGILQILAEDMTVELQALKAQAQSQLNQPIDLVVKDGAVSFGSLMCDAVDSCNYQDVVGVSPDLIVRPQGWKGNLPTLRAFSADAAFGEMGMQSNEVFWKQNTDPDSGSTPMFDGDGDGIEHELSVGDITALVMYFALQETPTTVIELADKELAVLADSDRERILAGQGLFAQIGCEGCHTPEFTVTSTLFMEPSPRALGAYEDQDLRLRTVGYDAETPLILDLAIMADEPRVSAAADGSTVIRPYSDLKRHYMGEHLADDNKAYVPLDASQFAVLTLPTDADDASWDTVTAEIPLGEFLTPELWGVGSTGPWLHDGRATTLSEAIMMHGADVPIGDVSEAQAERDAFAALSTNEQAQVIAFLRNLVIVDMAGEEDH